MGKLISAAVMMMVVGCGVAGPELEKEPAPAAPRDQLQLRAPEPMTHHVFTAIPRGEIVKRIRDNVSVDIHVSGALGAEGKTLTVLVGQVSCGLLISAIGTATVINGVAHLTLNTVPADSETGLMFFLDTDGNGQCTEADTMWSGMLVTQQSNLSVAVDLSKLESSPNWMCFALEEAP